MPICWVETGSERADILQFVHRAKQRSGFEFAKRYRTRLWQPSFNDRVLRDDEASLSVARHTIEKPVGAGLVDSPHDYPFLGSTLYSIGEILEAVCWQRNGSR